MDTSSYDAKIDSITKEREHTFRQLQANAASYIQAATMFFRGYFQQRVEREIVNHPELTQSLGIEKLGELKKELTALIKNTPEIVEERLRKEQVWDHLRQLPDGLGNAGRLSNDGHNLVYSAGGQIQEELRWIFGYVGQLLIKFGLAKGGHGSEWETKPGSAVPRYQYGLPTNEEMDTLMKKHKELFSAFVILQVRVLDAERERQQAIARDLWDHA